VDINEIIASGLLEMYVLGLTNADETRQVEQWRAQYPQLNEEIAGIEKTVQQYVSQYDKTPPAELKEKILIALTQLRDNNSTPNRVSLQSRWVQYGMVASVVLLAGSIVLNVVYYGRWQNSQQQVARLESEKQNLFAQNETQRTSLALSQTELDVLKSPTLKLVSLGAINPETQARVTVYWDTAKNSVFVNVNNLPDAPTDKQYQLWALVDGKPVDAGVMELGVASLQQLKLVSKAQAFAITLEKRGGATSPSLETMVVYGAV
jgi:anti-sigma-K factor RskA